MVAVSLAVAPASISPAASVGKTRRDTRVPLGTKLAGTVSGKLISPPRSVKLAGRTRMARAGNSGVGELGRAKPAA